MDGPPRFLGDHAHLSDYFDYPDHQVSTHGRRRVERYTFTFSTDISEILEESTAEEVISRVQGALNFVMDTRPDQLYRIIMIPSAPQADFLGIQRHAFGTTYHRDPMNDFANRFRDAAGKYDESEFEAYHEIVIEVTAPANNIAVRRGYSQVLSTKDYILISPHSRTNCAFTAIAICKGWRDNVKLLTDHNVQNQAGADLKRRFKKTDVAEGESNQI